MAKKSGNFYDTVIVGSGFAGASTAYHLISENNYKGKVLMLEARDRIGGRAYGQMIAGKHIELGCNWIHGLVNNPVRFQFGSFEFQFFELQKTASPFANVSN